MQGFGTFSGGKNVSLINSFILGPIVNIMKGLSLQYW